MAKLCIDMSAIVAPENDCLYVHSRKGDFELKGNQIGLLYQKLTPALDGRYSKKEILSAVPQSHYKLFADCLQRLEDSGVVAPFPQQLSFTGIPARIFSAEKQYYDIETESRKVRIYSKVPQLTPKPPGNCAIYICDEHEVGTLLASKFYRRFKKIALYLLIASTEDIHQLRKTGRLAPGLLNNLHQILNRLMNLPFSGGQIMVFRPEYGFLKSELHFSVQDLMSGELTDRLQLVRPLNIDQIPLIGVIAESPFWGFGLRQFGFNYPEVKRNLLVRYQAKILIEGCNTPKLKSYMVNRNERFVRKDMDTVQENSVQSPIFSDSNRDALFLQCLANEEIKHLVNDWHQLTPENYNENSGRLVQHALNLISIRKGNLQDCRYTATKGGLHVYKYADRLFYSFCCEKAFAEMLICILADMYSNTQIQPTETTLSLNNFLSGSGISRLVDAQIERLMKCSSNIFLHYASRRIWGNTVYFGKLSGVTI